MIWIRGKYRGLVRFCHYSGTHDVVGKDCDVISYVTIVRICWSLTRKVQDGKL
jgi:hypothetical protein